MANLPEGSAVCDRQQDQLQATAYHPLPADHRRTVALDLDEEREERDRVEGFRNAMIKDGVALVKFYMWLEKRSRGKSTR